MREKILFDDNWKFHYGDIDLPFPRTKGPVYTQSKTERMIWGPAAYNYNDNSDSYSPAKGICNDYWETVNLPHDYIISQTPDIKNNNTLGYFEYKNAWYRKRFKLNEDDRNKRITLYFEGVATHATIYVNGCLMKHNFCGYTSFEVDITDVAYFDKENVVAVYVDTSHHEGWWYEGAGIYRHVWLIKTDLVAVDLWGVYVNPQKEFENSAEGHDIWNVDIETTVINENIIDERVSVASTIVDKNGDEIAHVCDEISICAKDKFVLKQNVKVENPLLWDIEDPNLYQMVTKIIRNGIEIDKVITRFGFRTIKFDAEKGFFLNGRNIKIKGVCCHQDYGITGKAVPDNICRYRIELLKQMGANAYRTAHYPHPEATMDALDELGFLVMNETRWFESTKEGKEQLEMLIKRDRNRPSVIMWSIGNEEPFHLTEQGRRIAAALKIFIKKYDTSRPVTAAISNDPINSTILDLLDVIGINYNLKQYNAIHEKYPNIPIVSSECCATGTTRGWYLDDSEKRGYINAYDHDTNAWFLGREKTWKFIMEREWVAGGFQWAGIEHRGETVWPRLCSQSGALDLFLQKKDAFYQNKSLWTTEPMVHIIPHWNHDGREGELIDVWVYTNCEEVELFQDGKSLGVREIEPFGHGEWKVEYQKGKLTALGRNKGQVVATETVETTGEPVALKLRLENTIEYANNRDIAILTCYCVDSEGRFVPDASPFISFDTNKFGKIVGTGSDVCDHTPVTSPDRRMRAGLCSVAVKVGPNPGILKVYAKSPGLKSASISIELKPYTF